MRILEQFADSRVLIVDNERNLVMSLALNLEAEGLKNLSTAGDGVSALAMHEEEPYDLILLDNNMPRMRGPDVLRALRRRGDQVPVIMHTSWNREELDLDGRAGCLHPEAILPQRVRADVRDVLEIPPVPIAPAAGEFGVESDKPRRSRKSSRRRMRQ